MDPVRSAPAATPLEFKPDERLTRRQLAAGLTGMGLPIAPATLAAMASRGDGPPFQIWGRRPLYTWSAAVAWAQDRLSVPRRRVSEGSPSYPHVAV